MLCMTDYGHNLFLWKPRYIFSVPFFWFGRKWTKYSSSEDFDKQEIPLLSLWVIEIHFPLLPESDPLHPWTAGSSSLLTPLCQTKWHYHFYWIQLSFVCFWDFTKKAFHPSCMPQPLFFCQSKQYPYYRKANTIPQSKKNFKRVPICHLFDNDLYTASLTCVHPKGI